MGIQDRDYWKEDTRRPAMARPATGAARLVPVSWRPWLLWLALLALGTAGAAAWLKLRQGQPFPPTGTVHWYVALPDVPMAPLTLQAPAGRSHYTVRLDDWVSGAPLALIPVRAGETARLQVPLGRYRVTVAKGLAWQGVDASFGYRSRHQQSTQPLEFYRIGNQTFGHTITLETLAGNLPMAPAR
ncbi:hypothetical protein CLD22_23240 [Rubrivivax gelatinosus]|nr:hypothetical protein [Rubrivivax gelatinosus]